MLKLGVKICSSKLNICLDLPLYSTMLILGVEIIMDIVIYMIIMDIGWFQLDTYPAAYLKIKPDCQHSQHLETTILTFICSFAINQKMNR